MLKQSAKDVDIDFCILVSISIEKNQLIQYFIIDILNNLKNNPLFEDNKIKG